MIRLIPIHRFVNTEDKSYYNSEASYSSVIELCSGIICACMPSLKAFADRFFPKLMARSTGNGSSSGKASSGGLKEKASMPLRIVRIGSLKGGKWKEGQGQERNDSVAPPPPPKSDKQINVTTTVEQGWEDSDQESIERHKGQGWLPHRRVEDMV